MSNIAELRYGIMIVQQLYDELFDEKTGCARVDAGDALLRDICKTNGLKLFIPPGENRERIVTLEKSESIRAEDDSRFFTLHECDERITNMLTDTEAKIEKFIDELVDFYAKKHEKPIKVARSIVKYEMTSPSWILTAYAE